MILGSPDGWTVESATLSGVDASGDGGIAAALGLIGDGAYLIVRRYGRTVRWCRTETEVAALGVPLADLEPVSAAYPPPAVDQWLAERRRRRAVGGFR